MRHADRLDVYYGSELVGTVHDTSPISFEYAPAWLERPASMAVAAIALRPGRSDSAAVQAFFENLLPEGELRLHLARQRKASTLFSLLREVAGDTAGGFVIVPQGAAPQPAAYEATTWQALGNALSGYAALGLDIQRGARISLAGAQDKIGIAIFDDDVPRLPRGTSPSTHIVKPDIRRLGRVWHSAANETIVMRAAAHCGLPTAQVFYEPHTASCVVRRFDRLARPGATLMRLVQYDLCQLAGVVSERKYEQEGGPGLVQCAELIRRFSAQPAVDLRDLIAWVLFNLYTGNNDGHAKNLSLYHLPDRGVTLTPFYDLMCTRLYPGLSRQFAFSIGGEFDPGEMTGAHLAELAGQLGMRPRFLARQAADLADRLPQALDRAIDETGAALPHSAGVLAERLRRFVRSMTRKMAARLAS